MKCSLCGKTVEDGAVFCPFCGMQLGQEAPGAQAGANAPPEALRPNNSPLRRLGQTPQKAPRPLHRPAQRRAALCPAWGRRPRPACRRIVTRRHMASPIPSCSRECPMGGANGPAAGVNPYYAREFELIANGGKPHFNFAAFFLGFWHTLYRGCIKRFWLYMHCPGWLPWLWWAWR